MLVYVPKYYIMEGKHAKVEFIRKNSFGVMFSRHEDAPWATHTPFIYAEKADDHDVLLGHMARANPQWKDMDSQKVLVVFQGPHAYISPSWYIEKNQVPTWNYVAVHVTGTASVLDDAGTREVVAGLLSFYRSDANLIESLGDEPFRSLLKATVGFSIAIEKLEGVTKLNQNKSTASRANVAEQLLVSENPTTKELGRIMKDYISFKE